MKHYLEQPLEVEMRDARASDNTGLVSMQALRLYRISHWPSQLRAHGERIGP